MIHGLGVPLALPRFCPTITTRNRKRESKKKKREEEGQERTSRHSRNGSGGKAGEGEKDKWNAECVRYASTHGSTVCQGWSDLRQSLTSRECDCRRSWIQRKHVLPHEIPYVLAERTEWTEAKVLRTFAYRSVPRSFTRKTTLCALI